ncbi:LUD domain-containing protein [Natronomonas sp.]|uniref:LUD domain-containing protein n=1 Tax=Natronomonas sp. TaxID=2184060 RepID=UPI002FC3A1E1
MGADSIAQFEESLQGLADSCHRTDREGFADTLADVVVEPAVGASLPFDGVSLEGTPVVVDPSVDQLQEAATGVTTAGLGIANYGTVTVRSRAEGDELLSLYPRRHVVVLEASDIVPDMSAAFERLAAEFDDGQRSQVLTTGPSATADMGSLVQGVHGPESVHVIVLES